MGRDQLPYYYNNGKPVGLDLRKKTWKEYYLLAVIFVGFIILIAGVLWFVPNVEEDNSYEKTYYAFTGSIISINGGVTGAISPSLKPEADVAAINEGKVGLENVKLPQRELTQERNSPPAPLPVPEKGRLNHIEGIRVSDSATQVPVVDPRVNRGNVVEEDKVSTQEGNKDGGRGNDVDDNMREENEVKEIMEEDETVRERREKVIEMARHAWRGYVQYAWGDNELKPISKRGHSAAIFGKNTKVGATIVDSLDTLFLMGLMDEFNQGKEWVQNSLNIDQVRTDVSVFEFNIRFIGGLLTAYALSGDEIFKEKAVQIANKLLPAFNTPSGIPKSLINLGTGNIKNWGWASGGSSVLAEFGSLHLEFQYLTHLTENPVYLDKVKHIRAHLNGMTKPDGLYPNFLNPNTGNWGSKHISLGALGDSFYEYLLKSWLMTSKDDVQARDMFYDALGALEKHLVKKTNNQITYVTDVKNGRPDGKMQHLACFSGGMFALGAQHAINGQSEHYMDVAKALADTCHNSYQRTATKLGPEAFRVSPNGQMTSRNNEKMYLLRPETVETYFVLWRLTHDEKYRDWGWEVVEALEEKCRIESGGYTGLKDVYNANSPKDDVQQSFFIAETLKYLYLLYTDDSVISLDHWVFNTEAHPFPLLPGIPQIKADG